MNRAERRRREREIQKTKPALGLGLGWRWTVNCARKYRVVESPPRTIEYLEAESDAAQKRM